MSVLVHVAANMLGTHVRPRPLLACQFLLLCVGSGHLQVEHWFQPGGASVDPLTPLIILRQHETVLNHGRAANFIIKADNFSLSRHTKKRILTKLPSTSSTLLFHHVPSHSVLMICPTFRSTIGLLG